MLKLILCLLLLFSGALIGLHLSQKLTRRRDILLGFDRMFHRAQIQIEYNAGDLCEVFSDNFADFTFRRSLPFDIQWSHFIESLSYLLSKDDITMLKDFTKELGTADCEAQHRHIDLYAQLLQEHIFAANEDIRTKAKMVRILPVSVSMVLALLLI